MEVWRRAKMDDFNARIIIVSNGRTQVFRDNGEGGRGEAVVRWSDKIESRICKFSLSYPFCAIGVDGKRIDWFDHLDEEYKFRMVRSLMGKDRGWAWLFSEWYNEFASKRSGAELSWDHYNLKLVGFREISYQALLDILLDKPNIEDFERVCAMADEYLGSVEESKNG